MRKNATRRRLVEPDVRISRILCGAPDNAFAVHALARFVGEHSPEHIAWCGQIRSIPFKKSSYDNCVQLQ
jgi:hypothetical protein